MFAMREMQMLRVIIQAFIHGNEPSAVRLSRGPHATLTAIPLPLSGYLPPLNWNKPLLYVSRSGVSFQTTGYLTDQRAFAARPNQPGATQRMQSLIEIDLRSSNLVSSHHIASPTTEVDLVTGGERAKATADLVSLFGVLRLSKWTKLPSADVRDLGEGDRRCVFSLHAEGSDPLVSLAWLRPIHFGGELTVTVRQRAAMIEVSFRGYATHFPYFEGFVQYSGQTASLFRVSPQAGRTVADLLYGKQAGRLRGDVKLPLQGASASLTHEGAW